MLLKEFCHKIQKFFLPEIGVVLTAAGQAALTAIGNGAVLSLGGDTSVRLKHRQGRRQRQVLVMETVKVQKSLCTDIKFSIKERGK